SGGKPALLQGLGDRIDGIWLHTEGEVARTGTAVSRGAIQPEMNAAVRALHERDPRINPLRRETQDLAVKLLGLFQVSDLQHQLGDVLEGDHRVASPLRPAHTG